MIWLWLLNYIGIGILFLELAGAIPENTRGKFWSSFNPLWTILFIMFLWPIGAVAFLVGIANDMMDKD